MQDENKTAIKYAIFRVFYWPIFDRGQYTTLDLCHRINISVLLDLSAPQQCSQQAKILMKGIFCGRQYPRFSLLTFLPKVNLKTLVVLDITVKKSIASLMCHTFRRNVNTDSENG